MAGLEPMSSASSFTAWLAYCAGGRRAPDFAARHIQERLPADDERAGRADDLGAHLREVALAEQPGRRPITELGVEPLKPCLRDLVGIVPGDERGDLQRQPQTRCDAAVLGAAAPRPPLVHGARL